MRCASAATCSGRAALWFGAAALALSAAVGCSNPRDPELGEEPCPTYDGEIRPVLVSRCGECHSEADDEGGYRVDSYFAAVRPREDGTARVANDEDSLFVRAIRGELPDHPEVREEQRGLLEDWAMRCEAPQRDLTFHASSWMNPWSSGFHGQVLRQDAYDYASCRECHGDELAGGGAEVACSECHQQPLSACNNCHGGANAAPPEDLSYLTATTRLGVGAHQSHLNDGPVHKAYSCATCHVVPQEPEDDGHYQRGGEVDEQPAEVTMAEGTWDREAATCTVGCHAPQGDVPDERATNQEPTWTKVGEDQAACGTCHGLPPSSHGDTQLECHICHRPGFNGTQLNRVTHVNGQVEVSFQAGQCVGCHGTGTQPAPPVDLQGRTEETARGVGAHRAHLEARHQLSAPVTCDQCHLVPQELFSPGHLEGAPGAEVFPKVSGVGSLANARGAVSTYDPLFGTCTTYCHGAGVTLRSDTAANDQTPSWTGSTPEAACGTCHALPPQTGTHPNTGATACSNCHGATVTPLGAIIVNTDPQTGAVTSTHIDGQVQIQLP